MTEKNSTNMRINNEKGYKIVADNLGEYSILRADGTIVSTEIQDKIFAESVLDELNELYEEKDYWKKRALLLENKYNEGDSIEWLRNNTVWEQMPTNKRTYTTTNSDGKND